MTSEAKERPAFGVNLTGYFTGQFGIANSSRAFARALELAGVPHVLNKIVETFHGERYRSSWVYSTANPYAINLIHGNLEMSETFFQLKSPDYYLNRYNIGVCYWEMPRFPARLLPAFRFYDEIWVTSNFMAECLSKASPIPIVKMRYPLSISTTSIDRHPRRRFDLDEDLCIFLFAFDFHSTLERKNPIALLKAFKQAFGRDDRVLLILSVINSEADPIGAEMLEKISSNLKVKILKEHLSESDYLSLIAACDCYVSLHRSEGLGLVMAEAMCLGKPVIATAYSGNMDFMNGKNSLLVKYELVELDRDHGPYEKGNVWAEPDVEQAAKLMRWVYENKDEARAIGEKASRAIKEYMDANKASREIRARLRRIYRRSWGAGAPSRLERERKLLREELGRCDFVEPMSRLLALYMTRPDLQSTFPEVMNKEYSRLLQWTRDYVATGRDGASSILVDYVKWYEENEWLKLADELNKARNELATINARARNLSETIKGIEDSLAWKLILRYRTFNDRWLPSGTRRRAVADQLAIAFNTIVDKGLRDLFGR